MSIFEQFPKAAQLVKAYYLELFLQELLDEAIEYGEQLKKENDDKT